MAELEAVEQDIIDVLEAVGDTVNLLAAPPPSSSGRHTATSFLSADELMSVYASKMKV